MSQEPITLTFYLTIDEANSIISAIQELPARIANPISQKLREQAAHQIKQRQAEQAKAMNVVN